MRLPLQYVPQKIYIGELTGNFIQNAFQRIQESQEDLEDSIHLELKTL